MGGFPDSRSAFVWHCGWMPAADAVLLPLCIGLSLIGVIVVALAWRRGHRGRVVQGIGLALAPTALYFTGLLSLLWNAVVATAGWASRILFTPAVWFGITLLGVCVVLWVIGGLLAKRSAGRAPALADRKRPGLPAAKSRAGGQAGSPAKGQARGQARGQAPAKQAAPVDDDMAEIEAILKSRGIN